MASNDVLTELVKQMLAEGKLSLKAEVTDDRSKRKYFVLVRDLGVGDITETRSILYPAATKVCGCCGK